MKSNVISLADYKAKKAAIAIPVIWWIPVIYFYYVPPFFWGIRIE